MKQHFGLAGRDAQDANSSARRAQQPGHQIHQSRLARSVRSHKARDTRGDCEIHAVDSENLPIELGDILEHDRLFRIELLHLTTSYALILRARSKRERE